MSLRDHLAQKRAQLLTFKPTSTNKEALFALKKQVSDLNQCLRQLRAERSKFKQKVEECQSLCSTFREALDDTFKWIR